jgi:tetratricopeptide (TPR) repeat protein
LYDLALNNNRLSDQQKISYLEKARKIWVAIERTSNSTRVGLVQNINSANDLLSAVRRLAGAGSKERERIVAEITSKYPAAGDFITTVIDPPPPTESLFNLTYAQGIYFLRDCNYNESLECFKEAHKIRPGAAKTKKYYYDLMALIKLNKQIEELKRSTNSTPNEVLQLFNRIQQINVGFEVVQSNSSCTDSSGVMCSYIWEELPKTATKYNCDRIVSLSDKLFNCYLTNDQKAEVDQLRTACEQITNECIIAPKLIQGRIQEAQKLQNQEFHEASNSLLESIEADRNRLISICADFESEKFKELISAIRKENDRLIRLKNCTTIQEKAIREAISKAEEGLCNESKIAFFAADTSCLSQQFIREAKVELERVVTLCRKTQMQVYEDSAARSKQILFYKDEGIFLLKALTFTDTEADKSRIQTRLAINKCYRETGKNCEGVRPPKPCTDTTTIRQTNLQLLVGLNLSSLNLESLSPVIRFRDLIKTGSYKPTPHIGLRLNRQSFKKNIDFNTSLVYTPPTELSFLNDNGSNFSKLKYNNLDFDFNLKFHRLRDCNNKGRAYIFAGGNAGYK